MDEHLRYFERLYETYADAIFRHLYLRLGDRERAKELMQDVFMRTWQHIAAGNAIEHEKAFLYRAAHNVFVNEIRTDKRTHSLDEMQEDTGFDAVDDLALAGESAEHAELIRYLGTLKESYRSVLILRYLDDLPVIEIATLLEESETNISMRIKRALEKLREAYERQPNRTTHDHEQQ